ncbi:ralA-binding protein 1, partial [Sigmodon hispidus]
MTGSRDWTWRKCRRWQLWWLCEEEEEEKEAVAEQTAAGRLALGISMTECFLPPTSSHSEHRRAEHGSRLTWTPTSEVSPTKFPGLYWT